MTIRIIAGAWTFEFTSRRLAHGRPFADHRHHLQQYGALGTLQRDRRDHDPVGLRARSPVVSGIWLCFVKKLREKRATMLLQKGLAFRRDWSGTDSTEAGASSRRPKFHPALARASGSAAIDRRLNRRHPCKVNQTTLLRQRIRSFVSTQMTGDTSSADPMRASLWAMIKKTSSGFGEKNAASCRRRTSRKTSSFNSAR